MVIVVDESVLGQTRSLDYVRDHAGAWMSSIWTILSSSVGLSKVRLLKPLNVRAER